MSSAEVMDLREVIGWFETDSALSVTRRPAGTYTNGLYVAATPVSTTVQAHVQRATSEDVLSLPEAERTKKSIAIYVKAADALQIADEPSGVQGDLVTYQSETYEVKKLDDFDEVAGYYKATAVKVEVS